MANTLVFSLLCCRACTQVNSAWEQCPLPDFYSSKCTCLLSPNLHIVQTSALKMKAGNKQGGKVLSEDGLKNGEWKTPGATSGQALPKPAGRVLPGLESRLGLGKGCQGHNRRITRHNSSTRSGMRRENGQHTESISKWRRALWQMRALKLGHSVHLVPSTCFRDVSVGSEEPCWAGLHSLWFPWFLHLSSND